MGQAAVDRITDSGTPKRRLSPAVVLAAASPRQVLLIAVDPRVALVALVTVATLLAVLLRPRGVAEGVSALGAAP
jgi:hypothetical protein